MRNSSPPAPSASDLREMDELRLSFGIWGMLRASVPWSVQKSADRMDHRRPRELLRLVAGEASLLSLERPLGTPRRSSLGRSRGGTSVGVSE
jgi:hypothetical protein